MYIRQLSKEMQEAVAEHLAESGFSEEDIQNALDSKLSDLSDVIHFETCTAYVNYTKK